ncbi:hypothetical protein KP509_13G043200 [Ceratopteris richardii]|uniref:CCHC-type domain-containing protein n=1 Tax=Ceratopteris richardii TaxID=49495 RepID=A0A8T2TF06_CERRI|nr:hypothetical protein KP509_13G043200 [Ceratopteris richardii]
MAKQKPACGLENANMRQPNFGQNRRWIDSHPTMRHHVNRGWRFGPISNYVRCWCCEQIGHIAKYCPRVCSPLDFVPTCADCGKKRLCEHVCGSKEMTGIKVATNQADRCLSSLYVEVDKGGVTSSTDTARASESKDTGSHDRDLVELVKSLECQVDWLHVERDNERIKIEKLEENQVKMAEILGTWEKQVRVLKNENKERKRVNKSWRKDRVLPESENVVWDLRSGLMVADCFGVAIGEELSRDEDDLMRRVERMEHEIEKVQSIIRRYSDQSE